MEKRKNCKSNIMRSAALAFAGIIAVSFIWNIEMPVNVKGEESKAVSLPILNSDNSINYDGHTYALYSRKDWELNNYSEMKAFCGNMGGHLAVINSEEENQAIYNYVRTMGFKMAYFGYSDEIQEENWQWVTGSSAYTNWAEGQPNNGANNKYKVAENYAHFTGDGDGTWNDAPFGANTDRFVCEWDYIETRDVSAMAPNAAAAAKALSSAGLSLDEKILNIKTWYYDTEYDTGSSSAVSSVDGLRTFFYKDGDLKKIRAMQGAFDADQCPGADRLISDYYYHDGMLYFVFIHYYESEEYRYYLSETDEGIVCIRYIDPEGTVYDYTDGVPISAVPSETSRLCEQGKSADLLL